MELLPLGPEAPGCWVLAGQDLVWFCVGGFCCFGGWHPRGRLTLVRPEREVGFVTDCIVGRLARAPCEFSLSVQGRRVLRVSPSCRLGAPPPTGKVGTSSLKPQIPPVWWGSGEQLRAGHCKSKTFRGSYSGARRKCLGPSCVLGRQRLQSETFYQFH